MKTLITKKARSIISVLLVTLFAVSALGGCSKSDEELSENESEYWVWEEDDSADNTSEDQNSVATSGNSSVVSDSEKKTKNKNSSPDKLSNPNLTVCWPVTVDDHPEFTAVNKAFEKKYGGKVTVVGTGRYDDRAARLTNLVQSKTQVDVVFTGGEDYPSYAITNMVRPMDVNQFDFTKAPYKNSVNNPTHTSFNGKFYFLLTDICTPLVTCYNKTMFENAGLQTPLQLYKAGKWNWDTFRDAARTLSNDTNGDGKNDVYGFADYDINGLLCSNGTSLLKYDGKTYSPNNDERVKRAYQLYYDMYNIDKSICTDPWSWSTDMVQGKLGMVFQNSTYILFWKNQGAKYEYDFVPLPKGPNAKEYYSPGGAQHNFAIGATCKNQEAAYAYIKFYIEQTAGKYYNEYTGSAKYSADQEKRIKEYCSFNKISYSTNGFGNLKMDARSLLWEIRGGKSVGSVMEYWNNVLQQDINIALMTSN